jgi:hypothetical protein
MNSTFAVPSVQVSPEEAKQIASDAYIFGYPLITTEVTRVRMSNVATVEQMRAPTGTFFNIKGYPPATFRGVSATNADTLYSVAFLDLSEPQVFSHPDIPQRSGRFLRGIAAEGGLDAIR